MSTGAPANPQSVVEIELERDAPQILNRSMSRAELLTADAKPTVDAINTLIRDLYARDLLMSAWIGTLPKPGEDRSAPQGMDQRLDYAALPGAADDPRLPWFLYWEILAVMQYTQPRLKPGVRLLDAGGSSSLFCFYLASLGYEVHAIDLNEQLTVNARHVARTMGWRNMHSYVMNMREMSFPDLYFDFAYSICVFEHLDYPLKQDALHEMARTLKTDGVLCITFDWKNPAPGVFGYGKDTRIRNRISTWDDIQRQFLDTGLFELVGNQEFHDNGEHYLVHPKYGGEYSFGSLFLRKIRHPAKPVAVPALKRTTATSATDAAQPQAPDVTPDLTSLHATLDLSVVVCTYRQPERLRDALESLVAQSLPAGRFEIIVVDNNSGDETPDVVESFRDRHPRLKYVREDKQGLSHARNRGADEATGDYVVYIDDDAKASPHYLYVVHKAITDVEPDIMGGPIYPYYTSTKPAWYKDEYEIRRHLAHTGWGPKSVSGSNYVIRRELLDELGRFDPTLGMVGDTTRLGEERALLDLYRTRAPEQQRVYYDLDAVVFHHVPKFRMNPRYYLKRNFSAGFSNAQIRRLVTPQFGATARGKFIARSWWSRVRSPMKKHFGKGARRRFKQWMLEKGGVVFFETGRLAGCMPRAIRDRIIRP